jgi:TRAP-type mannitol/chloroaromatic compound transport system permease large subunit
MVAHDCMLCCSVAEACFANTGVLVCHALSYRVTIYTISTVTTGSSIQCPTLADQAQSCSSTAILDELQLLQAITDNTTIATAAILIVQLLLKPLMLLLLVLLVLLLSYSTTAASAAVGCPRTDQL